MVVKSQELSIRGILICKKLVRKIFCVFNTLNHSLVNLIEYHAKYL